MSNYRRITETNCNIWRNGGLLRNMTPQCDMVGLRSLITCIDAWIMLPDRAGSGSQIIPIGNCRDVLGFTGFCFSLARSSMSSDNGAAGKVRASIGLQVEFWCFVLYRFARRISAIQKRRSVACVEKRC